MSRQPLATPLFLDPAWQMSIGERSAIEGMLSEIRPQIAIEIGTAEGGALRRIAAHSEEVHSFDLVAPSEPPDGVELHVGDSHKLLPEALAAFADAGRNVEFVLVDGDHTAAGVERDLRDLLDSPAIAHTVIIVHDTANEEVRRGLDAIHFAAWPKVAHVDLDCVPGWIFKDESLLHEMWGGLGVVLVDSTRDAYAGGEVMQQRAFPAAPLLAQARDALVREAEEVERQAAREDARLRQQAAGEDAEEPLEALDADDQITALRARLERQVALQRDLERSISWRVTAPLRAGKRRLRDGGGT